MALLSPFVPFGLVLAFQAWLWPFWPVFGLSGTLQPDYLRKRCHLCSSIELSTWFTREFAETVLFHRVGRSALSDYSSHLADVHQLDHIQRRQYLQEAKLQPKVKVVEYESEANNSGRNHYRNPVQTQETVKITEK